MVEALRLGRSLYFKMKYKNHSLFFLKSKRETYTRAANRTKACVHVPLQPY